MTSSLPRHGILGTWHSTSSIPPSLRVLTSHGFFCGVKSHPWGIRRKIKMQSRTQGVWTRRVFLLPPLCFLRLGGFNHVSAISWSHLHPLLDHHLALQFKQPFFRQTPCISLRFSRAFLEAESWRCQTGTRLRPECMCSMHSTFTFLEIHTAGKCIRHGPSARSLACDVDDNELVFRAG